MTLERRFGVALFVLALGNGMLALGNVVAGGGTMLVVLEAIMAVVMAGLGYSFVYGDSEVSLSERLAAYVTILVAAVGVVLAATGFYMAVAL